MTPSELERLEKTALAIGYGRSLALPVETALSLVAEIRDLRLKYEEMTIAVLEEVHGPTELQIAKIRERQAECATRAERIMTAPASDYDTNPA